MKTTTSELHTCVIHEKCAKGVLFLLTHLIRIMDRINLFSAKFNVPIKRAFGDQHKDVHGPYLSARFQWQYSIVPKRPISNERISFKLTDFIMSGTFQLLNVPSGTKRSVRHHVDRCTRQSVKLKNLQRFDNFHSKQLNRKTKKYIFSIWKVDTKQLQKCWVFPDFHVKDPA